MSESGAPTWIELALERSITPSAADSAEYTSGVRLRHVANTTAEAWGQYRWIARLNSGSAAANYTDALYDSVQVLRDVYRAQPSVADAIAGTTLSPQEAERMYTANGSYVQHKYDFVTDAYDHTVHGLYHSERHIGTWIVTPSYEYKNGGPDNQELTSYGPTKFTGLYYAHIQMLNGGHYGAGDEVVDGEWSKLYGPFILYMNQAESRQDLYDDAVRLYQSEVLRWPYDFVDDEEYSSRNRGAVSGRLLVADKFDPRTANVTAANAFLWLTAPTSIHGRYTSQSKGYMYWTRAGRDGAFAFANVRAGEYELHATVVGAMDEFVSQTFAVKAATKTEVGTFTYSPPRNASTLFEIGIPDRTAAEFRNGDVYRSWGLYDLFDQQFPQSVHYAVREWRQNASQWRSQWNYAHVPIDGQSRDWTITFDSPQSAVGPYGHIRFAFASVVHCQLAIRINGTPVESIEDLNENDTAVYRDGIHGIYQTRYRTFDAKLLKANDNELVLTNQCKQRFDGIMYDYIRIELDGFIPQTATATAQS